MIEVNLLPGGRKRSARARGFSFKMPKLGGGGGLPADPYVLGAVGAAVVSLGLMGWLYFGVQHRKQDLEVQVTDAQHDSIRFADVITNTSKLRARSDSIAQRISIIQDIDQGRFVWAHIMDEVSRALPDYTWLRSVQQAGSSDPTLQIRIAGTTGSNFALTTFMRQLESSPFLDDVSLTRSEQAERGTQLVYDFELTADYTPPPLSDLQTVPLFGADTAAAADTTGD